MVSAFGLARGYLVTLLVTGAVVLVLAFLHLVLVVIANQLNVSTLTITQFFDLTFRVLLFSTLIPIGVIVYIVSVFINPLGSIGIDIVLNFVIDIVNIIPLINLGDVSWTTVDTSRWLPDFAILVNLSIEVLLGKPISTSLSFGGLPQIIGSIPNKF